ncbi:MAG: DUF480 domain-containing protein [Pseudomonadota bacterium]|nr:DUF480 domain-containing protein [Pseudomonadota bacterium]
MHSNLAFYETRVIGALLEKEITTPEQYPLSLNALTNACNQKSNRDPVLNLDEATVQQTLDGLIKKHLVSEKTGFGSRVTKYQHRFCNTAFGALKLSAQELAIIAELLLRGPQTPGELRTRAERLGKFNDVQEVEAALRSLIEREDGPFVAKLPREAGKRESRYAHLLSGEVQAAESVAGPDMEVSLTPSDHDRLSELEQQIAALRQELGEIRTLLDQRT